VSADQCIQMQVRRDAFILRAAGGCCSGDVAHHLLVAAQPASKMPGNRWKGKGKSDMATSKQLRAKLEHDKAQVQERLSLLKADSDSAGETREGSPFGKREEEATEAFELEKRMAMERSLKDSLAEINRALAKFETGDYGKCEMCGGKIEPDRLEARPQASVCMRCKGQQPKSASGVS